MPSAVGGEDGHHLARVLRLRAGETVTAADGSGVWRPYRVAEVAAAGVQLEAAGDIQQEPAPSPRLAVAFALTKGDKPELVVQKLTELGVDRIVPVLAERSVSRPDPDRAAAAAERWRRIAREAARQCRRATLPAIEALAPSPPCPGIPASSWPSGVGSRPRGSGPRRGTRSSSSSAPRAGSPTPRWTT